MYHTAQVSQAQSWVIRTPPRKAALSSRTQSMPSAQIGGTKGYDHPISNYLLHPDRFPTDPLFDMFHLVSLASTHAEIALRLVLEIAQSYAVVSTVLVLDDLRSS